MISVDSLVEFVELLWVFTQFLDQTLLFLMSIDVLTSLPPVVLNELVHSNDRCCRRSSSQKKFHFFDNFISKRQ